MEQFAPATWRSVRRSLARNVAWFIGALALVLAVSILVGTVLGMLYAVWVVGLSLVIWEIWIVISWQKGERPDRARSIISITPPTDLLEGRRGSLRRSPRTERRRK